jgi:hypothetical protein
MSSFDTHLRSSMFLFAVASAAACSSSNGTTSAGDAGSSDSGSPQAPNGFGPIGMKEAGSDAPHSYLLPFTPSNVPAPDLSTVGDVTITGNCTIDTDMKQFDDDCGIPTGADGEVPYTFSSAPQSDPSQSKVTILAVRSLTVSPSAQLQVQGGVPLVVVAATTASIQGTVTAQAGGFTCSTQGQGSGPGGGGGEPSFASEVGGGGGAYCGIGGSGANATQAGGAATPGGQAYGTQAIVPLLGGSAGGASPGGQSGGSGGGAIQISAGVSIIVGSGGAVSAPGGGAGIDYSVGGGSGGAILLEAPTVDVEGVLAANGGAANGGSDPTRAPGGLPNSNPAAQTGQPEAGVGSAGGNVNGGNGSVTPNGIGGGGGGAGRIRINTKTGVATIGSNATTSPATSTQCVSQGTLAH